MVTEVTSTPTRPVDNVVITTKGLQDRNITYTSWDDCGKKGKLILTLISNFIILIRIKHNIVKHLVVSGVFNIKLLKCGF